jgi:Domain of unknown function (DUF1707)
MPDRTPFFHRHPHAFGALFIGGILTSAYIAAVLLETRATVPLLWPIGMTVLTMWLVVCLVNNNRVHRAELASRAAVKQVRRAEVAPRFSVYRLRTDGPLAQRIGTAEREQVASALADHYAAGRLDRAEFDTRRDVALTATYRRDLVDLFDDLPGGV